MWLLAAFKNSFVQSTEIINSFMEAVKKNIIFHMSDKN
jgi:hypothetical protein